MNDDISDETIEIDEIKDIKEIDEIEEDDNLLLVDNMRVLLFEKIIGDLENPYATLEDIIIICEFIENRIYDDIIKTNTKEIANIIIDTSKHWTYIIKTLLIIQKLNKDDLLLEITNICEDNFVIEKEEDIITNYALPDALLEAVYNQIKRILYKTIENKELCNELDIERAEKLYQEIIKNSIIETSIYNK